jgi:outer membrane protein assembly factor BamB
MHLRFSHPLFKRMLLPLLILTACLVACGGPQNPDDCSIMPPDKNPHLTLVGGTLLLQTDYASSLYALQASSGAHLWQYTNIGSFTVLQNTIYTSSSDALYALQANNGQPRWQVPNMEFLTATPDMVFTTSYNPTPLLIALDAATGKKLWQQKIDPNTPPESIQVANGIVYVATDYGTVKALKSSDGTQVWQYSNGSPSDRPLENSLSMSVSNGIVYVKSDQLYALRASDGHLLWSFPKSSQFMQLNNGIIYVITNHLASGQFVSDALYALRADDGTQLWHWTMPTSNQSYQLTISASVIYVGPRYWDYRSSNTYRDHLYALNSSTGVPLWNITISPQEASLAVTGTAAYVLSNKTLQAYRTTDGTVLWHSATKMSETGLLATNGIVYVGTAGNTNSCFATTPSTIEAVNADNGSSLWALTLGAVTSPALQ